MIGESENSGIDEAAERYRRAQALVHEVHELAETERVRRLDEACADDPALRREVEWLLASIENPSDDELGALQLGVETERNAVFSKARLDAQTAASYRLIERIGEGGMGQVWLAEREQGEVRQRVALKMLRGTGVGEPGALARFLDEGRILGALNHPNIAHLLEAGQGQDGVPYLAMEFVDGETIDRWCQARSLVLRERIALFIKVCAAVEYAHSNLVIHRDLKPVNILIGASGEPKLLDFGIAKLLDADAGKTRAATATRAMTLAYASPEQIEGKRLGTASDIYSLGIVLYELLAGVRPFDHLDTDHARSNAIVSGDVAPPSAIQRRLITHARQPASTSRIPADLDAIVMKALRREPSQRYASVAELADDLRAFLASRPVQAMRGRTGYRMRRFAWRNRWALGVTVLVLALASAFTWRTVLAEREARAQAAISDRVAEFLVSVFAASDSNVNPSLTHALTARGVLDAGAARIDGELGDQPRIRARLYEAIGNAYRHMNENAKGVAMLRKAADINLDPAIGQPLDASRCLEAMANAMANGQFPASDAERAARESLELAMKLTAPGSQEVANAWMVLSLALNRSGNLVAAEQAALTTLAMNEKLRASPGSRYSAAHNNLCIIYANRGMLAEAAKFCELNLKLKREEGRDVALSMGISRVAQLRAAQGDFVQALAVADEGLDLIRELKGDASPFGVVFLSRKAVILDDAGRHDEAGVAFRSALANAVALHGAESGEALNARFLLARHQRYVGESDPAIASLRELLPVFEQDYGAEDPRVLSLKTELAQALLDNGNANLEVRDLLDQAMNGWMSKDDPDAVSPAYTKLARAEWFNMNGEVLEASRLIEQLVAPESRANRQVKAAAKALQSGDAQPSKLGSAGAGQIPGLL